MVFFKKTLSLIWWVITAPFRFLKWLCFPFNVEKMTPINQRRFHNFKANRRGYWSLYIFGFLFFLTLFSEFIANDKPLLMSYKGSLYTPVLKYYPETEFGGFFETEANYKDPVVNCLIKTGGSEQCEDKPLETLKTADKTGWILWPPIRYSYNTINRFLPEPAPARPFWMMEKEKRCSAYQGGAENPSCHLSNMHWLGSDDQGRDVVARVLYGFRISVLFALILTGISSIIGVFSGAVQGYFGGWLDLIFQRFIELWTSIPQLYILLIMAAIFTPSFWLLLGIMLIFSWTSLVGVVRAEFFRGRNFEYIKAAKALGQGDYKIIFRHLLPNAMVATITFMPFIISGALTTLTALDFLGLGLPPGSPSLGELLSQGKTNLQAPWLGLSAFFVLALMLSLLIFIGEAVRDAFDPRKTFE